ncbi:MAG: hypothetical protein UR27_C0013G0042 [Candidatus Peregrinibacteria bacterium GW2011_GWA2_33_10]|nr:MAG: hypothetical protein UR27_C0013G0042 [Candidatus Peregrinibacteria bacterium GW2011_GWA2_33_10]KKP39173.1 MAG: hypothetical protein UR30_C0012G0047 [Candidatus Peregrinibacteria bacterium GW2011_GWC2_33_13]
MLNRIIIGLIGIPTGFLILYYRARLKDWIGNIYFAEKYLGRGGTWEILPLIGLGISILSFLYMIGSLQKIFFSLFGKFF